MLADALRHSALREVRHSPRFLALMGVLLIAAIGYGGRDVSRLRYATELTGDALGIGVAAAAFSVGLAVGGLASGPIADRFDPRRLLVVGMALQGLVSLVTALLLLTGVTLDGAYLATSFADGVFAGACVPALVTTQAAMVPVAARGAAEIISILRLGIGIALGLFIAGLVSSTPVALVGVGVLLCLVAWPIAVITRPVSIPRRGRDTGRVLDVLRTHPVLTRIVIADLVLCVAVPTQFSNVVLASDWDDALVTPVLVSGVAGVLVGRLVLALTGSRGVVRRELLESYGMFVALALLGVPLVATSVVYTAVWIPAAVLFVGSATTSYAQGLLAALVQQQVPDEVRGRLSGGVAAARSVLIAGSAILLTAVVVPFSTTAAAIFVAVLAVVALIVLRGFRGITADAVR